MDMLRINIFTICLTLYLYDENRSVAFVNMDVNEQRGHSMMADPHAFETMFGYTLSCFLWSRFGARQTVLRVINP